MKKTQYKKTSLSPLKESFGSPSVDSAYNLCYEEQQRLLSTGLSDDHQDLVRIRVLGWMFHFAPEHRMLAELARAVISCNGDREKYSELGQFFINFWIRSCEFADVQFFRFLSIYLCWFHPVRKYKGRTPSNSGHVSRPSFDSVVEQVKTELAQYPKNHTDAKQSVSFFRFSYLVDSIMHKALIRDGFRCVLTGRYDWASCEKNIELYNIAMSFPDIGTVPTQLAHIICESTNLDIHSNGKKLVSQSRPSCCN